MLGSYLYWLTTAALVLCLFMSLLRRQTIKDLAEARKKLLTEREEREQIRVELVHARTAAEKDLAAAKKQASEAKTAKGELEEVRDKLTSDRDALRAELDAAHVKLADRTASEELATKKIAELEERIEAERGGARVQEDKLGELSRDLQAARAKISELEKKVEAEVKSRKVAEDERNAAKTNATKIEQAHASEVKTLREKSTAIETELKEAKARLVQLEEELTAERSKVQTAGPASTGGDLLTALDADPYLNRGQKETIRMTYNQFTAKRKSS